MTERQPDDLYDALRDRLADYGQEPPAPLWAGIRAQLPPPVAQRRKRRRWATLLGLLLLLLSVGSRQWWRVAHHAGHSGFATTAASAAAAPQTAASNHPSTANKGRNSSEAGNAVDGQKHSATAAASVASSAPNPHASGSELAAISAANSSSAASRAVAATPDEAGSKLLAARPATVPRRSMQQLIALNRAGHPTGRTRPNRSDAGRWATAGSAVATASTGTSASAATSVADGIARRKQQQPQAQPAGRAAISAGRPVAAAPSAASSYREEAARNTGAKSLAGNPTNSGQPLAAPQSLPPGLNQPAEPRPAASSAAAAESSASFVAWSQLQPRRISLVATPWATPVAPRPVADTVFRLVLPVARRWAVQVLAGPALTYRRLGPAQQQNTLPGTISGNYPTSFDAATSNVAQLERSALGAGAQLSVRRTLGKQWALSAGLGYAEYATRLALRQVSSAAYQDSAAASIHRRDTYRFVTVPVRVSYGWTLTGRWHMGLLAGAEATLYVGGSATEGSACACQTQRWGLSGSPYRRVSLGASLGAEVRYRLTGRWELLAQPTATYLLTPLAQSAAYAERHLFGGTALLGASYDLP